MAVAPPFANLLCGMRTFRMKNKSLAAPRAQGGRLASRTSTGLTVGRLNRRSWYLLSAETRPPILLQASSSRIEGSRALAAVFRRRKRLQYREAHTGQVPPEARQKSPATRRASDCPTQSHFVPYHRATYVNRDLESWEGAPNPAPRAHPLSLPRTCALRQPRVIRNSLDLPGVFELALIFDVCARGAVRATESAAGLVVPPQTGPGCIDPS